MAFSLFDYFSAKELIHASSSGVEKNTFSVIENKLFFCDLCLLLFVPVKWLF